MNGVILDGLAVVPHESAGVPETVAGLSYKRHVIYLPCHRHRCPAQDTGYNMIITTTASGYCSIKAGASSAGGIPYATISQGI